jgi:hypothetical protein
MIAGCLYHLHSSLEIDVEERQLFHGVLKYVACLERNQFPTMMVCTIPRPFPRIRSRLRLCFKMTKNWNTKKSRVFEDDFRVIWFVREFTWTGRKYKEVKSWLSTLQHLPPKRIRHRAPCYFHTYNEVQCKAEIVIEIHGLAAQACSFTITSRSYLHWGS